MGSIRVTQQGPPYSGFKVTAVAANGPFGGFQRPSEVTWPDSVAYSQKNGNPEALALVQNPGEEEKEPDSPEPAWVTIKGFLFNPASWRRPSKILPVPDPRTV